MVWFWFWPFSVLLDVEIIRAGWQEWYILIVGLIVIKRAGEFQSKG
jgi:hypothetical protein